MGATPRDAREPIDGIDPLLDRATPGRLEARFDGGRGTKARGVEGRTSRRRDRPSRRRPKVRFAADLAFPIQAQDFLGTPVQPATVDTIRPPPACIDQTTRHRGRGA